MKFGRTRDSVILGDHIARLQSLRVPLDAKQALTLIWLHNFRDILKHTVFIKKIISYALINWLKQQAQGQYWHNLRVYYNENN